MPVYHINPEQKPRPYKLYTDAQFITMLVLNLLMIVLYLRNPLEASTIIITYYLQSVLIGVFYVIQLLIKKRIDGGQNRLIGPLFFTFHFGMFHFVYFIFLITMMDEIPGIVDFSVLGFSLATIIAGSVTNTIKMVYNKDGQAPSLSIFVPYLRIVPMHLFIFMAFTRFDATKFIYFLLLKTAADIITYLVTSTGKRQTSVSA